MAGQMDCQASTSSASFWSGIKINASQVASAIGCHQYKRREQTLNTVWRQSHERTYFIGNALENEEEVIAIIAKHWRKASGKTLEFLSEVLFEDWDKQEYTLVQLLKVLFPEYGCEKKFHLDELRLEIQSFVLSKTDSDFQERLRLQKAQVTKADIQEEVKKLKDDEKRPISKSLTKICEKREVKDQETIEIVQSKLNKERGIALESNAISKYQELKNIKVQKVPKVFKREMEYNGLTWTLHGQIDGLTVKNKENKVIEVKNRVNSYKIPIPEYDRIQLQSYMFLCKKQNGSLVEHFKGNQKETSVTFQEDDWNHRVTPALMEAVCKVKNQIETYQLLLNSCADFQFALHNEEAKCKVDECEMKQQ